MRGGCAAAARSRGGTRGEGDAARQTYVLHIYRSRAVRGWQWGARLEQLPGGESRRFTDPEALLAHLRTLIRAGDPAEAPPNTPPGTSDPEEENA